MSTEPEARDPFSVAGGAKVATVADAEKAGAAVAGGAIYGAADPALAAKELRAAIV